jgi:hypothetical protein
LRVKGGHEEREEAQKRRQEDCRQENEDWKFWIFDFGFWIQGVPTAATTGLVPVEP